MRSEDEMLKLIMDTAANDERVRAVLLNGSRADKDAVKDKYQDYDIVYIVNEFNNFVKDHKWIDVFGERIILQMPDEISIGIRDNLSFHYLMLFKDQNRIDLTLFPLNRISEFEHDNNTIVLTDKDNMFGDIPSGNKYIIKRPTEKEFTDCCNEFWWVSTYVAKGLKRDEIVYAMDMLNGPVRSMFLKMTEWYVGVVTDFSVSFGKSGKNIKKYLLTELYKRILETYPDANTENIRKALFRMTEVFSELAKETAGKLNYYYNVEEENNVKEYLEVI